MKKHYKYLKHVIKHKWFVFLGCVNLSRSGSFFWSLLWLGIIHDWSKFRPSEWLAYANWFGGAYGVRWSPDTNDRHRDELALHESANQKFQHAWLNHIHRNKHHWQHWMIPEGDSVKLLEIPDIYLLEMVADWYGAGRAISGRKEISSWYEKNKTKINLHSKSRKILENIIENFDKNHD